MSRVPIKNKKIWPTYEVIMTEIDDETFDDIAVKTVSKCV
jgi:hypothetical protein